MNKNGVAIKFQNYRFLGFISSVRQNKTEIDYYSLHKYSLIYQGKSRRIFSLVICDSSDTAVSIFLDRPNQDWDIAHKGNYPG
jgi:predicted N-formylglutamate amidohydrolase